MSDFETEPVKGLPQHLPPGERILWQGQPSWRALALRVFHVRKIAIYFAAILVWRIAQAWHDGVPLAGAFVSSMGLVVAALLGIGIAAALALIYARTSVFTITNRRVVMRYGAALPWSLNLPFRVIDAADMKLHSDGTADLPLSLTGHGRISYLHLWPFARPWRINKPQPSLRGLPDGVQVARILAQALKSYAESTSPDGAVAMPVPAPSPQPAESLATPAAAAA